MSLRRNLARLMVAGIVVQHYLAGLAAFGAASFDANAVTGYVLVLIALALTLLARVARTARRTVWLSGLLVPLTVLQPVLALVPRVQAPALSAGHVVNGLLIFAISLRVVQGTTD